MAQTTAAALVYADARGLASHGVSRVPQYAMHLRNGRADGTVRPLVSHAKGGAALVDAQCGLAFPACALAVDTAIARAREFGVAFCGVTHSHHCGAMDYHLAPLAQAGLIGMGFTTSPAAINAWGGKKPLFGTNPVAAVFPRQGKSPLIIDLSLTEVARGKIMVAAKDGKPIPLGWAFDADGKPTTDAKAALTGSMAAIGGVKGVLLALIVELLCCAVTGARFGFENDSFFEPGRPASIGHALLAIDPGALAGMAAYQERMETLLAAMLVDDGVRLPGERRHKLTADALANGLAIPDAVLKQLRELAA